METYYSLQEIDNSKCFKIVACILFTLIFLLGFIIGNNVDILKCNCSNYSVSP